MLKHIESYIPAGSILITEDNSYWYSCGSWSLNQMENVVPCILAYVPETPQFKKKEQQKTVQLYGKNFLKAFGQPYFLYQEIYYPALRHLIQENTFGKIAFLPKNKIITAYNPQQFAREYVANIQPEGNILLECCDYLGITLDNIGVGGSSLLFGKPVKRHEIDIEVIETFQK